jgi:DnaD/phage-associated family protein
MSKNPLLQTLIAMTGQENVITVHRPVVNFIGSLEAALFLEQMLYWTPRSKMGGWVAKSDKEWQAELCLTRYSVRSAAKTLSEKKLIDVQLKRFNNSPTNHYKVNWVELESQWTAWLEALSEIEQTDNDCLDSDSSLSEIAQTLTETTAETTDIDKDDAKVFKALEGLMGALNSSVPRYVDTWLEKHSLEWILKAIDDAKVRGARSEKYIDKILINWEANGYPKSREEQIKERKVNGGNHANRTNNPATSKQVDPQQWERDAELGRQILAQRAAQRAGM